MASQGGLLMMVAALATSCATIPGVRKITVPHKQASVENQSVIGLSDSIAKASEDGGALHLFLVHGMSNQPFGKPAKLGSGIQSYWDVVEKLKNKQWREDNEKLLTERAAAEQFSDLVANITNELHTPEMVSEKLTWLEDGKGIMGYQLRSEYMGVTKKGKTRRLVVHRNCWAFTVIPFKSELLALDDYRARNTYFLNKIMKDGIVTWGLMDAALYMGNQRSRMQNAVSKGLAMVGKEDLKKGRFAFGAASLGSIITLDTMARDAGKLNKNITEAFFRKEQPLYFFANQIGLLGPGGKEPLKNLASAQKAAVVAPALSSSLQNFAEAVAPAVKSTSTSKKEPAPKLTVVAFNDPADMLGYPVPAQETTSVEFRIVNVSVRNQAMGIWGTFVNPLDAHTGFPKTKGVMKIMTRGIKKLPAPPAEPEP